MNINKYLGFYELKSIRIPTVQWEKFTADTKLDESLLWTVRVAVEHGNDLHLPRIVGASADEAMRKGCELLEIFSRNGIVIYYPYFIAEKSGVLDISNSRIVIEAVNEDLWNFVTYGKKNVTIVLTNSYDEYHGDRNFLKPEELEELVKYSAVIRSRYRDVLSEGRSILAEWSFAYHTDVSHKPIGLKFLIFYELRNI